VPKPKNITRYCAILAGGIGAVGLTGWITDIPALQRIHPDFVTMKANTAIALVLASLSLLILQDEKVTRVKRRFAQLLAAVISLCGLLTLCEIVFGWHLGIDQFFFRETETAAGQSFPGRMGIASTVVFICLGAGLLVLDARIVGRYWATKFAAVAAVATTLVFLYYFFGIQQGEAVPRYATIALHTVVAFYALCGGIFFARPGRGVMLELLGPSMGSVVARRMLPAALFLPILLGSIIILGDRIGLFGVGFGAAGFVVLIILVFTGLIRTTAVAINRQEGERQRTEVALRRSEANLRDFVDNATVGLHWVGPDGIILWANQAELKLLGYAREEYIGHPVSKFHADAPVIEDILSRLTKGESLNEYAARLRCKDGSIRHVLIDSNVLFEDGRFVHTRCFTRDITESREADVVRARLAAIVMTCNDAIISKSLDGTVTTWNPGAEKTFGYTAEEMIGQSILRLIPPGLGDEEKYILGRLQAGKPVNHFETERMTKDGSRLPVSLTISPIYNSKGKIIGVSKIVRNITERKQAQTALKKSEEHFRALADNMTQLAWMSDAEGAIFWYNQRWFEYTGTTLEDMQGWGWEKVHHPDQLPRVLAVWTEHLSAGKDFEDTFLLLGADGRYRWFLTRAVPIRDTGGKVRSWFGTNTDVTEQRSAADALRRAKEEAEAASRAKDDFLAALSHELRTPLTPVLMMATALEADPALPAGMRDQLAMMRRNIELEARLIDDLLDLTRISHGKLAIMPVVTDVHEVLKHTAEIVLSDRLGKDVNISFEQQAVRHHALADPARIQQVFWNLIKNAIKFSPYGQSITVSTQNDADGRLIVTVADNGVGISAEALPNIFKAFDQGDNAGQHRYGGLGLGLAISKAITEAHGATISVESAGPGLGAAFTIVLESIDAPIRTGTDTSTVIGTAAGKLKLLIVEDHETTRTVLAQLLTRRGHHVTTAGNVQEALAAYNDGYYDAVISDLGLPDGSGMDLMREIQRLRPVPAIALSGYGMEDDVRRSKEAGFSAHLVKPVNMEQLRQLIDQIKPQELPRSVIHSLP